MSVDNFKKTAKRNLNLKDFELPSEPINVTGQRSYNILADRLYILRMMIKNPNTQDFKIPEKLEWLRDEINACYRIQKNWDWNQSYVYVTVRHGVVTSETDDQWHVDGFSMRQPHLPEQNYIWSNCYPTEYADQPFYIPDDFDPMKHNLHTFLGENVHENNIKQVPAGYVALINPYCVHRRPVVPAGTLRSFWRISFLPVEIEDDTCTPNPLLPTRRYNRKDIRQSLVRYEPTIVS